MNNESLIVPAGDIAALIRSIRDRRVILDADLPPLYGVEIRALAILRSMAAMELPSRK